MRCSMRDAGLPEAPTRGGVLLVLESYPAALPPTAPALPVDTPWFDAACRRWRVPATLLRPTWRINALDRAPQGRWLSPARARVAEEVRHRRPSAVVAAGHVARDAVAAALGMRTPPLWAEPVIVAPPNGGVPLRVLAVPHFSGRSRALNCPRLGTATSSALRRVLSGSP